MERLASALKYRYLIGLLLVLSVSCDDDNDGGGGTNDNLKGTWTVSQSTIQASVGAQSLTDYLIHVEGLSESDATAKYALFEALIQSELEGSITFRSDKTYESTFGGSTDNGTWSLSADEKSLTLDAGTADEVVLQVNELTSTKLNVTLTQSTMEDLDDDSGTPDVNILTKATVILNQ